MKHVRCRPLAFALLLALTLCGAARAAEESFLNGYLRDHENGVAVTCWYGDDADAQAAAQNAESLFCAVYDGDGALLTVAGLNPKSGMQTVVAKCDTALVDCAKLFAADADRKPLGPSLTLKPAAASSAVPQFMSGYPVVSENGVSVSGSSMTRVKVMTDRSCRLYWALYKRDAGYATAARFMSDTLPGCEKHSMMVMTGNQSALINLTGLEDETAYDLDLWLTNSDFTAFSYITRLSFSTLDATPPEFRMAPNVSAAHEHSVTVQYNLNENATLYWILLESGSKFPNPPTGGGAITVDYAIQQVKSGNGGLDHGRANARANATGTFQVQGLTAQKSYDIWYVAVDGAENHSEFRVGTPDALPASSDPRGVCMLTAYTLDRQPPTVTQEVTKYPDGSPTTPYADTDVRLIFNEGIRRFSTGEVLADLYDAVKNATGDAARASAKEKLGAFLRATVTLQVGSGTSFAAVPERTADESEWTIDYRNATVAWEDGNLVLTFPTTDDANSALKLYGGKSYRFLLQDLSDLSENLNRITSLTTDVFTTMPAQILFQEISLSNLNYPPGLSVVDLSFSASPVAVSRADSDAAWDLLFWTDTTSSFEVFRRSRLSTSTVYDQAWAKLQNPLGTGGQGSAMIPVTAEAGTMAGQSMHVHLCQYNSGSVPALNSLEDGRVYEYAVRFLEIDGETDRGLWDADVAFDVSAVAGSASALVNLAANLTKARLASAKTTGVVQEIGSPAPFHMTRTFIATSAPTFANGAPTFTPSDTTVNMWFQMTRPGTVHYLLAPAGGTVTAKDGQNRTVDWSRYLEIPESGENSALTPFTLSSPSWLNIVNQRFSGAGVRVGSIDVDGRGSTCTVTGLKSETHYFAYFVLQGATGSVYSTSAQLFRFTTLEAAPPSVQMSLKNPVATFSANQESVVDYAIVDIDPNILDPLIYNVFWNNTPSGGRQANTSYLQVDSVLQAMSMDTGLGSVFDVYATKAYKDSVAAYIRQSLMDGDSVIGIGKGVRVSPTSSLTIDCSQLPMKEGHKYAVLTVTQSVDGGSNVFRAVSPVVPPDSTPPLIIDITENLTMDGSDSIELNTCSGFATLTFDSELRYLDSGTLKILDLGPHYSTLRDNAYKPMADIGSSSPATQITVSSGQVAQVNHATSVINLTLTNAAPGATITFPTLLCDEYGNTHVSALTVKLNVTTTLTGYDAAGRAVYIHKPALEVSKSWDGRTAG